MPGDRRKAHHSGDKQPFYEEHDWTETRYAGTFLGSSRISVKNFPVHYGLSGTTTDISVKSL
jgi:hypothetical protein